MAPLNEVPVRTERASCKIKKTQSELKRLLDLRSKARRDRSFGGSRLNTIKEKLVFTIWKPNFRQAQGPQQSGMTEAEDQRREWNKTSEADIPQAKAKRLSNHIANAKTIRRADLSTCRKVDTKVSQGANPKTDRE
jgi:hypothetical protein